MANEVRANRRFTGRQLTICVVALCAAAILTPVSVTAATVATTAIVDAQAPTRSVDVTAAGQMEALVSGKVGLVPGTPGTPLHREDTTASVSLDTIGLPIPQGRNVAITSINVRAGEAGGWNQLQWREANASGVCNGTGAILGTIANFQLAGPDNFNLTFPTPQIRAKTSKALCIEAVSAASLSIVIDGYTY